MTSNQDTLKDLDHKTILFVDSKLLAEECSLYASKWWDYKPLHPLEATYEYAEQFKLAVKRSIRKRKCIWMGLNYKGLKEDDFLLCSKSVITGLWKGRQMADRHGIPYDFYCSEAIRYSEQRNYTFIPHPNQMYKVRSTYKKDVSMVTHIVDAWVTANINRLFYAQSKFYSIDAYQRNRHWVEHQLYLVDLINTRSIPKYLIIGDLVYKKRMLDEQTVKNSIQGGDYLLKAAKQYI